MLDGRYGKLLSGCLVAVGLASSGCGATDDVAGTVVTEDPDGAPPAATPEPESVDDPENTEPPELDIAEDPESPADKPETTATVGLCEGADRPERCDADPDTFDAYGAASLVSFLELVDDQSCCADFDDDGETDNAMGEGFAAIDKLDALNEEVANSLVNGSQTIILELAELDDLQNDPSLTLNVWTGNRLTDEMSSGEANQVELDRASIEQGVVPLFSFDEATVADGILQASKGEMELQASFNGVWLQPVVQDVTVSARLDADDMADGVALRDGEVGGRVELQQLYSQINSVAESCDCLDLDGPLIDSNPERDVGVCAKPDVSTCEAAERKECVGLVEVCPVMDIIAVNIADIDSDGDGLVDSISLGALFEAERAVITGVTR